MALTVTPTDANKALVRRAIGYNHGTAEDPTEIFSSDFVAYMPGQPPMDRGTFEHYVAGVTGGMPGYTHDIHDQIAQGDLVVNRISWRGVHSGDLAGVPATGRSIELRGINMFRVKGGRVVEQWAELDIFGLLQQIGAIPPPASAAPEAHTIGS
jgi:predicted ester cyclase